MMRAHWKRWHKVWGTILIVALAVGVADWVARLFAYRVYHQSQQQLVQQAAKQWDLFLLSTAQQILFQRHISICQELLVPEKRQKLWRQVEGWVDEMRRSAGADWWVLLDRQGRPVASTPAGLEFSLKRATWQASMNFFPCRIALFPETDKSPALLGIGVPLEGNPPPGQLWFVFRVSKLVNLLQDPTSLGIWELQTLEGKPLVRLTAGKGSAPVTTFAFPLKELPAQLVAFVPANAVALEIWTFRWLLLALLLIAFWAVAKSVRAIAPAPSSTLALKLTEIFEQLSDQFMASRDIQALCQELAEAIIREFRFSLAFVFRLDSKSGAYRLTGFAPSRLLREALARHEQVDMLLSLSFAPSALEELENSTSCSRPDWWFFFGESLPEKMKRSLQNLLALKEGWCALLFMEGKPIGALFVATAGEGFSEEERQALELVRQQAGMLIGMAADWEEKELARQRASQYQKALLQLSKELSSKDNLEQQLQRIAQASRQVLGVSRVSVWQVTLNRQHIHCLAADGEDAEALVGETLNLGHRMTYLASLENERVVAVSSVTEDPRTAELAEDYWLPHGIASTIDAPVRAEGRIIGIVCFEHKEHRHWLEEEITFVAEVADLTARLFLEANQQRRERYLATLSQIALQMLVSTDWQGVLPVFLEDLGRAAEADRAFCLQLETSESGEQNLRCLGIWSAEELNEEGDWHFPLNLVAAPHHLAAMERGEIVVELIRLMPEPYRQFYEERGVKALLVAPIFVESYWWGILGFSARRIERTWNEEDIATLRIAASLLGSVIERQRSIERQWEQERQFRALVEGATVGIYRSTPEGRLLLANPALAQMLGYEDPNELIASVTDLATQVYLNPQHRQDFVQMLLTKGVVHHFVVPLRRRGGRVIWAAISGRAVYNPDDSVRYFEGFVQDITARKQAEDLLTRRLEQLSVLYHLTAALQRYESTEQAAKEVLKGAMKAIRAEGGLVALMEADGLTVKAQESLSEAYCTTVDSFSPWALESDAFRPVVIPDIASAQLPDPLKQAIADEGIRAILCVPIAWQNRLRGKLHLCCHQPRSFTEEEIRLVQTIAQHFALALVRKEAEEQLRRSEQDFRQLFENAVVGIYRSTPEGRFLMANETLARINGYDSVEELMSLDITTQIYLNPEDRERFKQLMREQGFVANYRYPIKRKDGSIGWVTKWARAVRDRTSGEVLYYEGFVLDITEQVRLEQRLQSLQAASRALIMRLDVESILQVAISEMSHLYPDGAVLVFRSQTDDSNLVLEGANEVAQNIMSLLRLNIGNILKPRGFPILEERLYSGEAILIKDLQQGVGSSIKALSDLGYRSILLRGIGDSSHLWGIIMVCQKGAPFGEEDVAFLNSFCDYLSIAIRNALLFQQVQQAYEELRGLQDRVVEQERLRALGQIASGIAHDINNALVPIQGFAEILLEHSDPVVHDAAEVIFKSANDIAATVQRMREFYRTRSGEEVLEPVDLNGICKDALMMTRPRWFNMAQEQGIEIVPQLELADNIPLFSGIPNEIRQAIVNLIFNAVDAMPEGGTLTLRTYQRERSGRVWAVVEVEDTGIGMDEETKRRAIDPFFTTKGERGSGLGLTAVYGIVQRHEGFLEIDSEPGKGTTVRLWFPSSTVLSVELPKGVVPSLRVLVIDDEPSVRETLSLLLRRDGHLTSTAIDGEEGLEKFRTAQRQGQPFDLVITDLGMPRMDGLTVARNIKAISPETPVVLLSGWGFRIRHEEVRDVIDAVMTKPATHQQLRRVLNQVWNKRMAISN